ncbi:hypothetical protein PIB30_077945 [Stylosanthes scabra]|uniref:Uncharacterized protein n=1 Tax=Stylosanthes scabra TaxID=79078 RepID=A0ABU6YNA5_9FABA|nr:hypothetical protein [Stylosanthes scabra]
MWNPRSSFLKLRQGSSSFRPFGVGYTGIREDIAEASSSTEEKWLKKLENRETEYEVMPMMLISFSSMSFAH